jgi:DNA-binding CsgD family transcriptional regulator
MENIPSYIGLMVLAGGMVWLAPRLFLRYPQRMLLFYVNAVVFSYAFGVVDIVGRFLALELLARLTPPPGVSATVAFVFRLLAMPCLVLSWYFFIRMILEIRGRRFSFPLQAAFFILQAGALVAYFPTADVTSLSSPGIGLPLYDLIMLVFNIVNRGALFILFVWATFAPNGRNDPERRRGLKVFTGIYAVAYVLYGMAALTMKSRGFLCYSYPILEFFMHVPPFLFLKAFLGKYYAHYPLEPVREGALAGFFARHQISSREQEIIRLLLEGKSGRDMAEELYVSLKTVKTHLSNIYRKIGVKSRWQLITLIRNSRQHYQEF